MIGCTILVWKYGPLEGNPTWPADLGIFFQCFILFIVALIHFFAWGNIVMTNTPILLACAVGGFILQVIEEQFLLINRYQWRVINMMVTGWRYRAIESKFSFLNWTNSKWVSAYHMLHMTGIYVGFESFRLKYPSGRQILGLSFPMHSFKYQYGKCSWRNFIKML